MKTETKHFKVAAISSNTNSFGLKSIVLVAEDGEAWQILKSPYGGDKLLEVGEILPFETSGRYLQNASQLHFECPHRLDNCPPAALRDIWNQPVPA